MATSVPESEFLYWEFPAYGGQQAIRQGKWKAVRQGMSKARTLQDASLELFDLSIDPNESNDLATKHPDVVADLTHLMVAARTPSNRFPFPLLDRHGRSSIKPGINNNFVSKDLKVDEWQAKFEVESREIYTARNEIVKAMSLSDGTVVADIGAGTGLFTFLFSKAVQPTGHVMAVDISPGFLKHINAQTKIRGIDSVTTMRCREDSIMLSADSVDVAFVCDTYHHFEFPESTLASIHSALKAKGQLVVIDFDRIPGTSRDWILGHVRADKQTFRSEIEQAGFRFVAEHPIPGLSENYYLQFERR